MTRLLLLLLTVVACARGNALLLDKRPEWLALCKRSDPDLNECIKDGLQLMFPAIAKGIPEIEVEKFEPLFIKTIGITKGQKAVSVTGSLDDLYVYGPSNASFTSAALDLENGRWEFGLAAPYLRLESNYKIKGKILLLPVVGSGDSTIHLSNCTCHVTTEIEMKEVENREIIQIPKMHVKFSVAGMRLHLNNLFNGNKVLGQTVNQFLNKNALQVIEELKEDIGEALSNVFTDILNNAFKHLPTDLWLPKE